MVAEVVVEATARAVGMAMEVRGWVAGREMVEAMDLAAAERAVDKAATRYFRPPSRKIRRSDTRTASSDDDLGCTSSCSA